MSYRPARRGILLGCLVLILTGAFPRITRASDEIPVGFNLFDPFAGSRIYVPGRGLISVLGVPLISYPEFGSAYLGDTDSILYRSDALSDTDPSHRQTNIEMRAMQLASTNGNLFFSLDSDPLNKSTGTMKITSWGAEPHPKATFTWALTLNFKVKPLNEPEEDLSVDLVVSDTHWSHFAPAGAVLIPGKNYKLNGVDESGDFWPGCFAATGDSGTSILFKSAGAVSCPEPATAILLGAGLFGIAGAARRRNGPLT